MQPEPAVAESDALQNGRRFVGVRNAAGLMIFGSVLCAFVGFIPIGIWVSGRGGNDKTGSDPWMFGTPVLLIAAFGFICALGAARLKNWGRIALLIAGALLTAIGIAAWFEFFYGLQELPQFRGNVVFGGIVWTATGIWWLSYFSLKPVRDLFKYPPPPDRTDRRPLSVIVVAWFMIWLVIYVFDSTFLFPYLRHLNTWKHTGAVFIFVAILVLIAIPAIGILCASRWGVTAALADLVLVFGAGGLLMYKDGLRWPVHGQSASWASEAGQFAINAAVISVLLLRRKAYIAATAPLNPQSLEDSPS